MDATNGTRKKMPAGTDPHGLNPRQRKFVELFTSGMTGGRAYEAAGYVARGAEANKNASDLVRTAKVAAAIAEARGKLMVESGFTKERLIEIAVKILTSPPSEASMDNPLCELVLTRTGPTAVFPDKIACMDRLGKMLGFFTAEKQEPQGAQGSGELAELVRATRAGESMSAE
jgi:hypothetical protein